MHHDRMRPAPIAAAISAGTPVVLAIGVVEYHGQHLPTGVDLLIVTETLARLGDAIITLPPFAYGAASHAVAGPGRAARCTLTQPRCCRWPRRCSRPCATPACATRTP